jgi:hypothetical protein
VPTPLPIADGRRFGCTRCGACCLEPGCVYIRDDELDPIARHLGEARETLIARLRLLREDGKWMLDATDGSGCPLLTPDRTCSVHEVKPKQCATFPFWPDLVDDAAVWEDSKRFCPGLDSPQGKIYSRGEILAIRAGWVGT